MTDRTWLALLVVGVPLASAAVAACAPRRFVQPVGVAGSATAGLAALVLAAVALLQPERPHVGEWVVVDAATGVLVGVIGLLGLAGALVSPAFLRSSGSSLVRTTRQPRVYYASLAAFQATLVAVPLSGNLGVAWLCLEATTAFSALLVGFTGKRGALEAGWKYLVLTSIGLGVALLGIAMFDAATPGGGIEGLAWKALAETTMDGDAAPVAYVLLLVGLAAKAGWAPVHNWLPDAHSEAPPPVSALLSGALLPAVALVAWRAADSLSRSVGRSSAHSLLIAFGLVSLAFAVPFLWRSLPWKRLLAYSSLEHMGVIALGIGFATPLALAGVVVHIAGHAIAKALGFYAATPLLAVAPASARSAVTGVARSEPRLGAAMGLSLGALAALPPSPLLVSEVLVVAGGFSAGRGWEAAAMAVLLALGFLGLAHALIETTCGPPRPAALGVEHDLRGLRMLTVVAGVLLVALSAGALWLPGSSIVEALVRGLG